MSENPVVFSDISLGGSPKGRIEMELHADIVPKTVRETRPEMTFANFSATMRGKGAVPWTLQ